MHISEGVLPTAVLAVGWAVTATGVWKGTKDLSLEDAATAGVSAAGFFVASLIRVPLGPTSVHLLLNGLIGIILLWRAFPVIFVALLLQALLFQFGGVMVLGCNTLVMGLPAVLAGLLFRIRMPGVSSKWIWLRGALCGAFAVCCSTLLLAAVLISAGEAFVVTAKVAFIAHIPIMLAEAVITGGAVAFLARVAPELLESGVRPQ
ncbi:MAG: cobalt transporter CbiM [Synergistota bacterium]|nr:cobalt transporter CbiM [Synergistota bacterium]